MEEILKFDKHRAFDKALGPEKKINKRKVLVYSGV